MLTNLHIIKYSVSLNFCLILLIWYYCNIFLFLLLYFSLKEILAESGPCAALFEAQGTQKKVS